MAPGQSYAQRENVWAFGTNAGLDFNTGTPVVISTNIVANEACASVCNTNGQLLFYTNGECVWDRTGNFMQDGFSICSAGIGSTTQGALIVPMPDSSSKYYIFSLASIENGPGWWGRLYYSVVDMSLNNGLGGIVPGQMQILVDTGLQENMTAVAGKNCNIWLLTISQHGILKAFNIDHNGIDYVPVQSPVLPGSGTLASPVAGSMSVSPDRNKLAIADVGLTLYNFDAATGMASNPVSLSNASYHYSVCFSPNSAKLYTIQFGDPSLKQYDLSSGIPAVMRNSLVAVNPGSAAPTTLKLGPDGKIYCLRPGSALGVIHQPNLGGAACMYAAWSIPLNNTTFAKLGFPNVVPFIVPTGDTVFSTQIIDVTECFTETHQLQADTTSADLVWEDGSTLPLRTINGPGTYRATYSRHCVLYSDTFIVRFPNAIPLISIYGGCKGSSNGMAVAYTPNEDYSYTWRNTASVIVSTSDTLQHASGGNYTLHVVTPSGCESTFTVFIPEEEHTASFQADRIVCQGTAVFFSNTSDNHFTRFEWTFGDGNGSSLQNPTHTYMPAGYYSARLIATGVVCIDTAYQTITVDSILNGRYIAGPDSICTGQSVTFYPDTDSTVLNLHWSYGDGTGMTAPAAPVVQHAYDVSGTMPVQLLTEYRACPAAAFTDTVRVYALPKIYLGPDSGLCLDGTYLVLQNQLSAPDAYTSRWNTGDTTAAIKIVHPGTYSLTISSGPLGCSATESVIVRKDCYVDIPNAFTPNGDGANDYFFPRQLLSRKVTRFHMQVLNRWGQQVFETTRTDGRGWDGRFNGSPQPGGVYIYLINLSIDGQREEQYNGNVTLIR